MKSAIIHGALLLVMLVYGYRTWTRDKSITPDVGSVELWQRSPSDLKFIEYKTENRTVRVEKRTDGAGDYWWGSETTVTKQPKAVTPPATPPADPTKPADATKPADPAKPADATKPADPAKPADATKPADPAKPADATKPADPAKPADATKPADPAKPAEPPKPPEPEMEEVTNVNEFPTGDATEQLVKLVASAHALRSLGTVSDADKKTYQLDTSKTTLTASFRDGDHTFLVGGQVYGGGDRYVLDTSSGLGYVFSRELLSPLETGFTALRLSDPRGFDQDAAEQVTVTANGKTRTAVRVTTALEGGQTKTWADAATKKPDQALANFVDNSFNLTPTQFDPKLKVSEMTPVLTLVYRNGKGQQLGEVKLYKRTRAAEMPADGTGDPANPPPPLVEYYVVTPKTRVLSQVHRSLAERSEQDLTTVFP